MFGLRKHGVRSSFVGKTSISDLDDDTLIEILMRLPTIKHMISCELVSKLWCTLISTVCIPRITSPPLYGLLYSTCPNPPPNKRELRYPWNFTCFNPLRASSSSSSSIIADATTVLPVTPSPECLCDCYNGVLLFVHPSSRQYYICNPFTRQYIAIPFSGSANPPPKTGALIFDPHYKIVQISGPSILRSINVFDGLTRHWSSHNLNLELAISTSTWSQRSIFFHGSVCRLSHSAHLVKMDVRNIGSCQAIELPKGVVKGVPIGCLGVSQGTLHYAWSDYKDQVMIWTFLVDSQQWLFKRTLCLQYFLQHPLCSGLHSYTDLSVYAFHPNSDVFFIGCYAGIFSYDPDTNRLEVICKLSKDRMIYGGQYIVFHFSVNLTTLDAYGKRINNEPEPAEQVQKKSRLAVISEMTAALDYLGSLGRDLFVMHDN